MLKVRTQGRSSLVSTQLRPTSPQRPDVSRGTTSRRSVDRDNLIRSESAMMGTGMGPNTQISGNALTIDLDPMLTGLAPRDEQSNGLIPIFRDMYYNDPIAGSTVDMFSQLPFSEFSLGGVSDKAALAKFNEAIERLGLRYLLPEASVDLLVTGKHCHSLIYNQDRRQFVDLMPHAAENLKLTTLPFYSQDPILEVTFPREVTQALSSNSPRINTLRALIGNKIFDAITKGRLELDPISTVYMARKSFTNTDNGTSFLRRMLPIYLIEKNLFRGTLVESARRQRGIMHLTLGDGETWIPTPEDMSFVTNLFMDADSDPVGAIIATQQGVEVNEFRQGGEFWKSSDYADSVQNHKLRALGVSEAFLSGDVNFATSDTGLQVFLDQIRMFRDSWTRRMFYDKLFPLISLVNGFTLGRNGKLQIREGLINTVKPEEIMFALNDGSRLLRPTVNWQKQLKNVGDQQMLEMLNSLTEKGFPIPLRLMAAAGGLDMDELLRQKDEDMQLRKSLQEYNDLIKSLVPAEGAGEEEELSESSAIETLSSYAARGSASSVKRLGRKVPLLDREFGEAGEVVEKSKSGKRLKPVLRQAKAQREANEKIVRALTARARRR